MHEKKQMKQKRRKGELIRKESKGEERRKEIMCSEKQRVWERRERHYTTEEWSEKGRRE